VTPKPKDFDEYWSAAIAEMNQTDPRPELIPADFRSPLAECFHLYFTGVGGAKVHAKYLRPIGALKNQPALLMFHGYSLDSGDWSDKLKYAASGFHVAALDCRGQGGLSEDVGGVKGYTHTGHIIRGLGDSPKKLLFRDIFLDTAMLARIVTSMDGVDENRLGATGESQGGGLTLACAALEPRIACLAPVFPFLCDYKRVWDLDLAKDAYQELTDYFRRFDPMHKRETEIFTALGYIDAVHLAPRIKGRTLMITGLMDTICPPSTQYAAYNAITAPKEHLLYHDYTHEPLPGHDDIIYKFFTDMLLQNR
jgi:cephalosporin-C deacetylase